MNLTSVLIFKPGAHIEITLHTAHPSSENHWGFCVVSCNMFSLLGHNVSSHHLVLRVMLFPTDIPELLLQMVPQINRLFPCSSLLKSYLSLAMTRCEVWESLCKWAVSPAQFHRSWQGSARTAIALAAIECHTDGCIIGKKWTSGLWALRPLTASNKPEGCLKGHYKAKVVRAASKASRITRAQGTSFRNTGGFSSWMCLAI